MPTQSLSKPKSAPISLTPLSMTKIFKDLKKANAAFAAAYPGDSGDRQPVHTVYGGAHLFKADTAQKLGKLALRSLEEYAPNAEALAEAVGLSGSRELHQTVYSRVVEKLRREPVEDYRIDFEDGYGNRLDAEEDNHADLCADELARGMKSAILPPFIGIRIKPMSPELHIRSLRTLDIVVTSLVARAGRKLPDNFVITIPKVTMPEHVSTVARTCDLLEAKLKLQKGVLKLELMIETPQSILNMDGASNLRALVNAAAGRCVGAHFGTYDYTALCNITAAYQNMVHPACDFAKHMMQVSLAQTGIHLSDGATNIMPAPPHRAGSEGSLTPQQQEENRKAVHNAWRMHYDHARHSLKHAFYQGWDLHPAQLPTRYAAVYAFFLESFDAASVRLKNFVEKAAQATLVGDVFDDAATGQGLLNYFLRALNCGAITMEEAQRTGLTMNDFKSRSFLKILGSRRK